MKFGETKVCSKCGEEKSLSEFKVIKTKKKKYYGCCKACINEQFRKYRFRKRLEEGFKLYESGKFAKIKRKYKKIHLELTLKYTESEIHYIDRDEKFVRLLDYKSAWISNYGRVVLKTEEGKYELLKGRYEHGELVYTLDQNVYLKTKKQWGYRRKKVFASQLVIQCFIVNYDIKNNTRYWQLNGDLKDYYYKNLYPMTEKQYQRINDLYNAGEHITEKLILEVVNDSEYKPDSWNPWYVQRAYEDVGYVGGEYEYSSEVFRRWSNMIQRCYNGKIHEYKPYYADKSVCEEWLNFQNFKIWYDEHIVSDEKLDLDKDLICQSSNEYSPETCVLISHYLNTVFEDRGMNSVITKNPDGRYVATMMILNKKLNVGEFDTEADAKIGLIEYKKTYIDNLAEKCKGKIPDYAYEAMKRWKVKERDVA